MEQSITLGSTVTTTAIYLRREKQVGFNATQKFWESAPTAPRLGIFIGWRTIADGVRHWEDSYTFTPSSYIRAALVVFSTRTKPVLVPGGAIQPNCELLAIEEKLQNIAIPSSLPFSDREIAKTYVNEALRNIIALQSWLKEER